MGKPTGFLEYERETGCVISPEERIQNFNEFHIPLSSEMQQKQGARCMDCGVPFCQSGMMIGGMVSGCPLNNLVPEWNDLIYNGNWEQAWRRLMKTNSFPEFTSRVCPALCEAACTCNLNGAPVSVKENEHGIIEYGYEHGLMKADPPKVRTGKRIAVVGSGPSGLAAADQLNKRGHQVTVFERSDRVGGLLMYGIPNMKLDKKVVNRRVELMEKEGVVFKLDTEIGKNYPAVKLVNEFDAVVLCTGSTKPRMLTCEGADLKGVHYAVDFLKANTKSLLDSNLEDRMFISAEGKNVIVVGGGDTGTDCVGTSIRHGCKSVTQLEIMPELSEERMPNNPWPEWPRVCKTDYGQQEAITVYGHDPRIYETTVKEFIKDKDGNVKGAKCVKLDWQKDPKTGRMNMTEVPDSEYVIDCEVVLIAAGFLGSQKYVADSFGVELNERTNVKTACPKSYATNVPKVFVAGDMHRGQSLVVWAIHEGREAAVAVDSMLVGYTNLM